MYLVKGFAESSVGIPYTPLIVANLFQRYVKVQYYLYSVCWRQSVYFQTQRPGESEIQQAMLFHLISFDFCFCCFTANFLFSVAFFFQICLSCVLLKKKKTHMFGSNVHARSCTWYAAINFLLTGGFNVLFNSITWCAMSLQIWRN